MKPRTCIRLRLLGRLAIAFADQPDPIRLSTRKSGALLAYLAMSPEQTARREELAALLWGGCSDQQARQSLRQALAMLRKELRWSEFLSADTEVVRMQPGQWSVDAIDFEGLSKSSDPGDLDQAARLFGGEFLAGLNIDEEGFDEWVRGQRQRVQIAAARLCETLASRPDLVIDSQEAVAAVERLMALDPLREDWQRLALTLYARYRGKNEALAQAEVFAAVLQRELGAAPEKATRGLVERIRADEFGMVPHAAPGLLPATAANEIHGAPTTPGDRPAPDRLSPPARRSWTAPIEHPSRRIAAAALIAVVVLGGGFFGLNRSHTDSDLPARQKNFPASPKSLATAANQPDPWQPPLRDSSAFAMKGIIPIAILPFTPVGDADASGRLIADMMTDDLTNLLSRIPSIRVISRQTMSRYRDQPIDIAAIGTELQVRYVLEGSTRTQDGVMRVNLQLIEPATRLPVWSSRVEREDADRYAVRDEIVTRIARELQVNVMPIEGERRSTDPTADAADFLGWSAIFTAGSQISIESYKKAESYFNQALARDPQRVSALTGLASFHGNMAAQRLDADTAYHLQKAREILDDVIRRDPDNATALFQLGVITQAGSVGPGTLDQSLSYFRRVVELNPSNPGAHAHIGHALARIGQPQQGIDYIRYAMRLSPRDPALSLWQEFLGNAQLELNQYAEAIESFRRSATLTPRYPRAWAGLAAAYALAGNTVEAKSSLGRLKTISANAKTTDAKSADVTPQMLLERLGRRKDSRLHQGLALALAPTDDPWQPPAPPGPAPEKASTQPSGITAILVLPFTSVGAPGEQSALSADLITDDLTNALSRAAGFRVISRQTAMSYRGQRVDAAAVGSELGVHYVLEGTVEAQGSGLSASVELIETKGRSRVWSGRYDRAGPDHLLILDDIARSVGRELQINVTHAEGAVTAQDPGVRALIYKGFSAIADAGRLGQPALEQSEKYFTQALAREPDNPRALTGLGMYHVQMAVNLYAPDPAPHLAKAEAILLQVIERHPNAGGPYRLMGVLNIARGRPEIASEWLQREIAINPSDAPSYAQLGRTMTMRGHPAEGIKYILYAMRLSPRDQAMAFWLGMAGMTELEQGHDQKAIAYLERQLALKPGHARALIVLAAVHALSGNTDAARSRLEELRKALPHLSSEKLVERYFGESDGVELRRLREGLRLAVSIPR